MKKNKQLNLYFNDQPISGKKINIDNRNNLIISVFIIFFFIICFRLIFLGFDKNDFVEAKNYENY